MARGRRTEGIPREMTAAHEGRSLCLTEQTYSLEALLESDRMFVDFFNAFLSLPIFPEPLQYRREYGVFELVSDAKGRLASRIKAAVRSTRAPRPIYRPVRQHSYSHIPLVPIVEPTATQQLEIDTSFTSKSLNREQGMEWVREMRLPLFLESQLYAEYRLCVLLSQCSGTRAQPREFRVRRVQTAGPSVPAGHGLTEPGPTRPRQDTTESDSSLATWVPPEKLLQTMFVSFGSTPSTDTTVWAAQVSSMTSSCAVTPVLSRSLVPTPSVITPPVTRTACYSAASAEPVRQQILPERPVTVPESVTLEPVRQQVLPERHVTVPESVTLEPVRQQVLPDRPVTVPESVTLDPDPSLEFTSLEQLSSVIVGTAFKYAAADICGLTVRDIQHQQFLRELIPDQKLRLITKDDLRTTKLAFPTTDVAQPGGNTSHQGSTKSGTPTEALEERVATREWSVHPQKDESIKEQDVEHASPRQQTEARHEQKVDCRQQTQHTAQLEECDSKDENKERDNGMTTLTKEQNSSMADLTKEKDSSTADLTKDQDSSSDEESILNSDDDYEDRDEFFHKKQCKVKCLRSRQVFLMFERFLKGTKGELSWNLWLGMESLKLKNINHIERYISLIRKLCDGTDYGNKIELQVREMSGQRVPSNLTLDNISMVQTTILQPLLHYWAPRFLLKQRLQTSDKRVDVYSNGRQPMYGQVVSSTVLPITPLRPQSCRPRIQIEPHIQVSETGIPEVCSTSPLVGNRRVYDLPGGDTSHNLSKQRKNRLNQLASELQQKTPRELISLRLGKPSVQQSTSSGQSKRPASAPARTTIHSQQGTAQVPEVIVEASQPAGTSPSTHGGPDSRRSSISASSDTSEWPGGRHMEGLLQALNTDQHSAFLHKYIHNSTNDVWHNCLRFWKDLQSYHKAFHTDVFDSFHLRKMAQSLHAHHVVEGCPRPVGCDEQVRRQVRVRLEPPYEDLFDEAEELVLEVLYEAWSRALQHDMAAFDKVEIKEIKRRLDTKSRYVISLKNRGIIKERPVTPEDLTEDSQEPVYDVTVWKSVSPEFREISLARLLQNRPEVDHFRQYLADNYASLDLTCWLDMETFRRMPDDKRRESKARDIASKYLNKEYFFGPNSPAGREGQELVIAAAGGRDNIVEGCPAGAAILDAQVYVQQRLEQKWLPLFLATDAFSERQRPRSGMGDVVEDVMIQRKKRSQAIWKMLENKWTSSSRDILTFRKALANPVTASTFRRYLSAVSRSDQFFENDVLFWQEIKRYKDLCHAHSDRALVQQKTAAIIQSFVDSPLVPSLQIDITPDMAERIMERKLEATPYLFRESQMTVFRVLMNKWQEFCQFRSNQNKDTLMPTLDGMRRQNQLMKKRRAQELQNNREKETAREPPVGLFVAGDDNDRADSEVGDLAAGSEDGHKKNVSWSYSRYVRALQQEDVLNNIDHLTFSSLTLNTRDGNIADEDSEDDNNIQDIPIPHQQKEQKLIRTSERRTSVREASEPMRPETAQNSKQKPDDMTKRPLLLPPTNVSPGRQTSKVVPTKPRPPVRDTSNWKQPAPRTSQHTLSRLIPPLVKQR